MTAAAKKKKTFKFWFEGQKYEFTTILTRINETKTEFRRWRWENMGGSDGEVSFDDDIFEKETLRLWSLIFSEGQFQFELKFPMFKYMNGWKEDWDFSTPVEVTVWREIGNDNIEPYKEGLNWDDLKTKPKTPSLKKVKELRAKLEKNNKHLLKRFW